MKKNIKKNNLRNHEEEFLKKWITPENEKVSEAKNFDIDKIRTELNKFNNPKEQLSYLLNTQTNIKRFIVNNKITDEEIALDSLTYAVINDDRDIPIEEILTSTFYQKRVLKNLVDGLEKTVDLIDIEIEDIQKKNKTLPAITIAENKRESTQNFQKTSSKKNKNTIKQLTNKCRMVLKSNNNLKKILSLSQKDRFDFIVNLLKVKYPDITENQILNSKDTIERYVKEGFIESNLT